MKNFRISSIIIFTTCTFSGFGQTKYTYNAPGQDCYCEFIMPLEPASRGVIVFDTEGEDVHLFAESNALISSGLFSDYTFLTIHLINAGFTQKEKCLDIITEQVTKRKHINQDLIFTISDHNAPPDSTFYDSGYRTHKYSNIASNNYQDILKALNDSTAGKPFITKDSETKKIDAFHEKSSNYSNDLDVSIFLNPTVLFGDQFHFDRGAITSYGLRLSKTFKLKHALSFSLGTSFKRTNEVAIRSTIKANARNAVLSDEDTLYINEEVKGHVLYSLELDYRYYTGHFKRTKWFFGVGIGITGTRSAKGKIEESVDLRGVDIFDPSSYPEIAQGDAFDLELVEKNQQLYHGLIEFGLEQRISPTLKFGLSLPLRVYYDESINFSGSSSIGLNFNLAFKISGSHKK